MGHRGMILEDGTHTGITCDPKVMLGKPCLAGTRLTVEFVVQRLADGETVEQMLDSYPSLTAEGIRSALAFAAASVRNDVFFPLFVGQPQPA